LWFDILTALDARGSLVSNGLTTDQKQKIRRDHAAATVRQLATVLQELAQNTIDAPTRYDYEAGYRGLLTFANKVSEGQVNPRRWEFLTWIQEPKDLDSLGQSVNFAKERSSG
jgi:hypothetical protein